MRKDCSKLFRLDGRLQTSAQKQTSNHVGRERVYVCMYVCVVKPSIVGLCALNAMPFLFYGWFDVFILTAGGCLARRVFAWGNCLERITVRESTRITHGISGVKKNEE